MINVLDGKLYIGKIAAAKLAADFGTPLYVYDQEVLTKNALAFKDTLDVEYPNSLVAFASKAFSCLGIYKLFDSLGLGCDCVSGGELFTAATAGIDLSKVIFHGCNKLPYELDMALEYGVGYLVANDENEIEMLEQSVQRVGKKPKVLLRCNPGIEAHTHEFVQTARPDSKFGVSVQDGKALEVIGKFLDCKYIDFVGIHCHIGSQILELEPFDLAVDMMCDLMLAVKEKYGVELSVLNMGGGFGIKYVAGDDSKQKNEYAVAVACALKRNIEKKHIAPPRLIIEPGRSLVAEGGLTLYCVGGIKDIVGQKKYVLVDGGMFDSPRFALYKAKYTVANVNRCGGISFDENGKLCLDESKENEDLESVTIGGKCCESGDVICENVLLSTDICRGDIIAVLGTGAYNFSMASNYNRNLIPPVILVNGDKVDYLVRPQTYEDIVGRDRIPKCLLK